MFDETIIDYTRRYYKTILKSNKIDILSMPPIFYKAMALAYNPLRRKGVFTENFDDEMAEFDEEKRRGLYVLNYYLNEN